MRSWRLSSQSMARYSSSPPTSAMPSSSPSVWASVSLPSDRAVASFERGSRMRARIMAAARARSRETRRSRSFSRPSLRAHPSTAATWPWGRDRRISKASPRVGSATPPLSRMRSPSTRPSGHLDRLARVRFLTLPSSRKDSRSRTAGGEFRLGTRSMYMGITVTDTLIHVKLIESSLHGYTYERDNPVKCLPLNGLPRQNARFSLEVRSNRGRQNGSARQG